MRILAREKQVKQLDEILHSKSPQFLAVYGRRRVGKTYLIKNFYQDKGIFFHITGNPKETARQQLVNFAHVYSEAFNNGEPVPIPGSWQDAFHVLRGAVKKSKPGRKIIMFF